MCGRANHGSEDFGCSEHSGPSVSSENSEDSPIASSEQSERIRPEQRPEKKTGIAATVLLLLVKGYRYGISPLFPPCCRYVPTCSEYAVEAIARYGALRGGRLALCRLLRCHPFAAGGYDPVK